MSTELIVITSFFAVLAAIYTEIPAYRARLKYTKARQDLKDSTDNLKSILLAKDDVISSYDLDISIKSFLEFNFHDLDPLLITSRSYKKYRLTESTVDFYYSDVKGVRYKPVRATLLNDSGLNRSAYKNQTHEVFRQSRTSSFSSRKYRKDNYVGGLAYST